jgi:sigma-B regulation protein RsbU (phosphoserine phosphatase)
VERVLPRGVGFGLSTPDLFAEELEERELAYAPGDVFLFVTDGITECQTTRGEEFGEERLVAALRDLAAGATAAGIRDRLVQAVRAFAGEAEQVDDQTVVVVRATG